jgi:hypothetical protein
VAGFRDLNELRACPEGGLDLDEVEHLGDPVPDVVACQHLFADLDCLGDRAAVTRTLEQRFSDQPDRLGESLNLSPRSRRRRANAAT